VLQTTPHLRDFTCPVCGVERRIEVQLRNQSVVVCLHADTKGTVLPIFQKVDQGIPVEEARVG